MKLSRCFQRLEADPRSGNNGKPLKGDLSGYLRCRLGDWRVIYRIEGAANRVVVVAIAHRRDAYE